MAKKTRWGRIAKLTELSAKVSSSYLGQRVAGVFQKDDEREESLKSTHLKNAERIVDTMGILKGAAMKVGQSLAVMADSRGGWAGCNINVSSGLLAFRRFGPRLTECCRVCLASQSPTNIYQRAIADAKASLRAFGNRELRGSDSQDRWNAYWRLAPRISEVRLLVLTT